MLSILSREGRHLWRKPYVLVSSIIIGYIEITIYEVPSLQASEWASERVNSGPSLYSFHWHSRVKSRKRVKNLKFNQSELMWRMNGKESCTYMYLVLID